MNRLNRLLLSLRSGRRRVAAVAMLLIAAIAFLLADGCTAMGVRAGGARRERMERSPQWQGGHFGHFENPQPLRNSVGGALSAMLHPSRYVSPSEQVPTVTPDPFLFTVPPPSGLRVTWLGHSSVLLEIDGHRVLTDPVWSERASPYSWVGPRRFYAPPIALADLPPLDAVVISHDHYDHLDYRTIVALRASRAVFVVPLGVGADLLGWGIPAERIIELDWWEPPPRRWWPTLPWHTATQHPIVSSQMNGAEGSGGSGR